MNHDDIDMSWYQKFFLDSEDYKPAEKAIFAGINKKTITNIYGTAKREMVLDVADNHLST